MNIFNLLIEWDWCSQPGVQGVFNIIKAILNVVRLVVPIGLIAVTTLDIAKKVINPEDKEGQKKIMTRLIAAVIVFFIPLFIQFTFRVIDWGTGRDGSYENAKSGLSQCWK